MLFFRDKNQTDKSLKIGDILMFRSNGAPWDAAIQAVSEEYTHVGCYAGNGNILDSNIFTGVSEHKLNFSLDYDIFRFSNLKDSECRALLKELRRHKGSWYDLFGAIGSGGILFYNKLFDDNKTIPPQTDAMRHCSEYITFGMRVVEPNFMFGTDPEFVIPDNIYQNSERLEFIG